MTRDAHLAPIQIGRPVANAHVVAEIAARLGLPEPDTTELHVTLAWSRNPVDWSNPVFAPRSYPLLVPPQTARIERFGRTGEVVALVLESPALQARHAALREAGAAWEFGDYAPHVTIAGAASQTLPDRVAIGEALLLASEYRKPAKTG